MSTVAADLPLSTPVDKRRLCEMLGWSRPTLDKKLREDPFFPVLKAGQGKRDPWEFDPRAVQDYVRNGKLSLANRERDEELAPPVAERAAPPTLVVAAPAVRAAEPAVVPTPDKSGRVVNQAEVTAKARKDELAIQVAEDKLRVSRGELVERGPLTLALTEVFVEWGAAMDLLPDSLAKQGILPEENVGRCIKALKTLREQMVLKVERLLATE